MKTLVRSVLVTGGLSLLLAVALLALILQPSPQTESQGTVFSSAAPVDISSVKVENEGGTYRYYYEGDGYVLDDIPGNIVDLDAFIAFMTNSANLSAIRQVEDAPLSRYGLETPASAVEIEFFNGNILKLTIGDREQISGNYYAAADGFSGVYLIAASKAEPFLQPKTQVISRQLTPPLAVSSPLSAIRDITFTGGFLQEPVTIQATAGGDEQTRLSALSFGTATHLVRGTGLYQLDQTYGVEILGSLFGIQTKGIMGYNLTEEDTRQLGFDTPWMTVEYDMINGADAAPVHQVLQIVQSQTTEFFATLKGSGVVYQIDRQPFMDIRYEKLLLRWFLTPMLMDVSAVSIEADGQSYRFALDQTDPKNPIVTYEETALDIQLFRSFYRLLTSAAHDGTYLGQLSPSQETPLLTITYEYANAAKSPDVMICYPGQVRRVNVWVNGAGEFAMKDQFVSRVLEGCANLIAGQAIEENW